MVISDIVYAVVMVAVTLFLALVVSFKGATMLPKKVTAPRKPKLLGELAVAHLEHQELSPEFFVWARTNHTLDHPHDCQYCLDDYRKANERIQNKATTKLLNRLGFEYTNEEIWAAWMKYDAKQLQYNARKAG